MKEFYDSILTSNEVHTSVIRIADLISENIKDDPFIGKVMPLLKPPIADLSKALGRTTDPTMVKLLSKKDGVRDSRYVALRDFCKAYSSDVDAALAEAGNTLVTIFRELGWSMHRQGYAVESSLLQALINRLETTPASTALAAIGGASRLTDLKTAQSDFETTFKQKVDVKTREEYPKIRNCRILISRYLGGMMSYIDLMAEINGGTFSSTATKIDEVVTEFETMARTRRTKKTSAENKDKQPPA